MPSGEAVKHLHIPFATKTTKLSMNVRVVFLFLNVCSFFGNVFMLGKHIHLLGSTFLHHPLGDLYVKQSRFSGELGS